MRAPAVLATGGQPPSRGLNGRERGTLMAAKEELIRLLRTGRVAEFNAARSSERNLRGATRDGVDIRGVNLSGADLREVELRKANLSGANLSWANLNWAILTGASLIKTNLIGAELHGANLSGADLREA